MMRSGKSYRLRAGRLFAVAVFALAAIWPALIQASPASAREGMASAWCGLGAPSADMRAALFAAYGDEGSVPDAAETGEPACLACAFAASPPDPVPAVLGLPPACVGVLQDKPAILPPARGPPLGARAPPL